MATIPEITDRLTAATIKAEEASEIQYQVANGDENTEVPTASGLTPSIKKWYNDLGQELEPMLAGIPARLNKAVLVYQTIAEADDAAAGLPDDQLVISMDVQNLYKVQASSLFFVGSTKIPVTPLSYQANGDGVSNDTAAFDSLEIDNIGIDIDLGGKTYAVSRPFVKNIYKNGWWIVGGIKFPSNGALETELSPAFDVGLIAKESASEVYKVLYADGRGGARTLQSIGFDGSDLYTNHNTTIDSDPTVVSVVNKFKDTGPTLLRSTGFAKPDSRLGHQGLAAQVLGDGSKILWTTSPNPPLGTPGNPGFDYSVGASRGIISFKFKNDADGYVDEPIQYRVVSASTPASSSTTPTLSTDGKWMIIRYVNNGFHIFRVFDVRVFSGVDRDLSNCYTHEFSIDITSITGAETIHSLSGFCSDGAHLYGIAAGLRQPITQAKFVFSIDLLGRGLRSVKSDIGETVVAEYSGIAPTYIETEGMSLIRIDGVLVPVLLLIADAGNASSYLGGRRLSLLMTMGQKVSTQNQSTNRTFYNNPDKTKIDALFSQEVRSWSSVAGVAHSAPLLNRVDTGMAGGYSRNGTPMLGVYASTTNVALVSVQPTVPLHLGVDTWHWTVTPAGILNPYVDGVSNFGTAARRINNSFFAVAPTIGSDSRIKHATRKFTDAERRVAARLRNLPRMYQLKDAVALKGEDAARWHCGVIAQDVIEAFTSEGLDWTKYALIGFDKWEDEYEDIDAVFEESTVLDVDGNPTKIEVQPALRVKVREAGELYSVKYTELEIFMYASVT